MQEYYLLTFESTHAAISTEQLLRPAGVSVMPVPRFISASCGLSLRILPSMREKAEEIFRSQSRLSGNEYAYYHITADTDSRDSVSCERLHPIK